MKTHCPISGTCIKPFLLSLVAGFAFIWVFDFILHANLLMDTYLQTPQLWRSEADMKEKFPFMLFNQFLIAFITAFIFTRHYEGKGIGEGVRYGILIGLLLGVEMMGSYAWMPISSTLALAWFFGGLAKGVGLGVVYALTYRDK